MEKMNEAKEMKVMNRTMGNLSQVRKTTLSEMKKPLISRRETFEDYG